MSLGRHSGVLVLTALLPVMGCVVPKDAGFAEVRKLVADRGVTGVRWNQGTREDEEAAVHVARLLSHDLTVAAAVQVALLNNPRLQATYERLGVAQAEVIQAGLLRNPSFFVHAGIPLGLPTGDGVAWEFSIVQEFVDLFMLPLRKRLAQAEFRRVKLEVADAVLGLVAEVRTAFYMAQASRQIAEMRRVILDAAEVAAGLAKKQQEAGNLSALDTASEQGLYAQARLDLLRAEGLVLADRERLTRLLGVFGRRVEWKLSPRLPELPQAEPPLDHIESFAVAHRLDLAAATQELEIVRSELSLTKGTRFLGALELGADAHREPEGVRVMGPTLRLELPIFDQGQARVARLIARRRQARRLVEALAIEVRSQVREARNRLV
jgi:outer membrane protein, heavy metal efflux system